LSSRPHIIRPLDPSKKKFPAAEIVGGIASGASASDLFLYMYHQGKSHRATNGSICVAIGRTIFANHRVSRALKAVGDEYQVFQAHNKCIYTFTDKFGQRKSATEVFLDVFPDLDEVTCIGIESVGKKGYSIYSMRYIDYTTIATTITPSVGEKVKFFVLDRELAVQEVGQCLDSAKLKFTDQRNTSVLGAFVFTCIGRSQEFYKMKNVTADCFMKKFPAIPMAGFFWYW